MKTSMSADEARRIALAAQGFAEPRPSAQLDRWHLRRVIAQIGLLQIDSVNVLVRSHYMPLFSRLGSYPAELLDSSWLGAPANASCSNIGAHASLMPFEMHPLFRWRMAEWATDKHSDSFGSHYRSSPEFMRAAIEEIAERGALSAREITGAGASKGGWWGWSDGKRALEALFAARPRRGGRTSRLRAPVRSAGENNSGARARDADARAR